MNNLLEEAQPPNPPGFYRTRRSGKMEKELSSKAFWLIVDFEKAVKRDKENSTAETVAEYKETLSKLIDYIAALEPDVDDNESVFEKIMKLSDGKTLGEIPQDVK